MSRPQPAPPPPGAVHITRSIVLPTPAVRLILQVAMKQRHRAHQVIRAAIHEVLSALGLRDVVRE
ncbi:MAG: hypothetical protein V4466_13955, partial [Pseudomonadota bacterium]